MSSYSPGFPSSFDPALLDLEHDFLPPAEIQTFSDDIEALQLCIAEDIARKTSEGIVIQHRAWNVADVFRSEGDYPIVTPIKHRNAMPIISSPISYPSSAFPFPLAESPKKRKRSDDLREPLKDVFNQNATRTIAGFLDESDDEDDLAALKEHNTKRRAVDSLKDLPTLPDALADYTPPASQGEVDHPEIIPVHDLDEYSFKSQTQSPVKLPSTLAQPSSLQPITRFTARNSTGKVINIAQKAKPTVATYEQLIAARSVPVVGKATTSYYGLNIHQLIDEAKALDAEKNSDVSYASQATSGRPHQSAQQPIDKGGNGTRTLMWTEKYRAKKFTDLVGDERTHRSVLRWLKAWDPIVFPGTGKQKSKAAKTTLPVEEQRHRKILLLTGPPGLGKTTLAHVCARQAGYEVQEINASDERSRDVVKGRIRDMVGTENVRGVNTKTTNGNVRKAGKPVCVVVDEVDGVVGGSSGAGEGGFIKALIDLINLDERNSKMIGQQDTSRGTSKKQRKGDRFRLLRPLILICNDLYHPSLRPLRQSSMAEVIHIRKPALNMVVARMQDIFIQEGIQCDSDGVRRLCEATWGVSTKKEGGTGSGTGEGDIRGVMVVGEWVAGRLKSSHNFGPQEKPHLSRKWVEDNFINDLRHGGGAARSLGRGGAKDVVERVFKEGAGFPKQAETIALSTAAVQAKKGVIGVAESAKRRAMERLREMVDTSGDCDRIVTDCFTAYPEKPFQDDTLLSKPTAAYEWLHFHDTLSSAVHGSQEWELLPYLSNSVLAFHSLFASPRQQNSNAISDLEVTSSPFSGPGAHFAASEQYKATKSQLFTLQSSLNLNLTRMFRSPEELALELVPYVLRMLSPDIKPVIVNTGASGSKSLASATVRKATEKVLVQKAVEAMAATGIHFEKSRVEIEDVANRSGGFVWRMEPPLDVLGAFETLGTRKEEKIRYAVRSVLEQEWRTDKARREMEDRKRRGGQTSEEEVNHHNREKTVEEKAAEAARRAVKRDFFGRIINDKPPVEGERKKTQNIGGDVGRIWLSFHEGFSNAVRKPITVDELLRGL